MVAVQNSTMTIKYGNGEEQKGFSDRFILERKTDEETNSFGISYSNTLKENGMWSALNHNETGTAVVGSPLNDSASWTTGGKQPINPEEERKTLQQLRSDLILSIKEKHMENVVQGIKNHNYR